MSIILTSKTVTVNILPSHFRKHVWMLSVLIDIWRYCSLQFSVDRGRYPPPPPATHTFTCTWYIYIIVSVYYEIDEFTLIHLIPIPCHRVHSSFLFSVFVSFFSTVRNMAPFFLDTFTYMINLSVTNLPSYHFPLSPVWVSY